MSDSTPSVVEGRTEQDLRAAIRSVVLELAPGGDEDPPADARLVEDLGFHSLALLELAFSLEDEFDLVPLDETTARKIVTIAAVQDHVVEELRGRGELSGAAS